MNLGVGNRLNKRSGRLVAIGLIIWAIGYLVYLSLR